MRVRNGTESLNVIPMQNQPVGDQAKENNPSLVACSIGTIDIGETALVITVIPKPKANPIIVKKLGKQRIKDMFAPTLEYDREVGKHA